MSPGGASDGHSESAASDSAEVRPFPESESVKLAVALSWGSRSRSSGVALLMWMREWSAAERAWSGNAGLMLVAVRVAKHGVRDELLPAVLGRIGGVRGIGDEEE